ncbi:MAG TPA: hypothetical protein VFW64_12760 [Pseudonocardiaceae bacterium]|nr:hypothetical protein [Pseudonocardiaceae bacterium]
MEKTMGGIRIEHLEDFSQVCPRQCLIQVLSRHQVGDIGLQTAEWKVENNDPDGSPRTLSARTVHVFRRQPDGSWRYLVDNAFPFG